VQNYNNISVAFVIIFLVYFMYIHYSLSQLTHLHTLVVSGNKLETLPEVIPKMESLTELHLCGCHLHTLPDR